jgi:hypothetical protein
MLLAPRRLLIFVFPQQEEQQQQPDSIQLTAPAVVLQVAGSR